MGKTIFLLGGGHWGGGHYITQCHSDLKSMFQFSDFPPPQECLAHILHPLPPHLTLASLGWGWVGYAHYVATSG